MHNTLRHSFCEDIQEEVNTHKPTNSTKLMKGQPSSSQDTFVYIHSQNHSWTPAVQVSVDHEGQRATVVRPIFKTEQQMLQCGSRNSRKYSKEEVVDLSDYPNGLLPMQNVDANGNLLDFRDMVTLPFVHEVRYVTSDPAVLDRLCPYTMSHLTNVLLFSLQHCFLTLIPLGGAAIQSQKAPPFREAIHPCRGHCGCGQSVPMVFRTVHGEEAGLLLQSFGLGRKPG